MSRAVSPRRRTASLRPPALLVSAVLVLALGGCASGGFLEPVVYRGEEPWQIPADAYPTQRLYRVHYEGPEIDASFRLTLYLEGAERYRMEASDTLGRRVWSLAVGETGATGETADGGDALFLDHREETYCRLERARRQTFVPIAHLPLVHLPRLLLGRMPADPFTDLRRRDGKISYVDRTGQTWSGETKPDGRLQWWSLVQGGEAVTWWRREGDEHLFYDRRGNQQLRWTEKVRESLNRRLEPLRVPEGYRPGSCGEAVETLG